MEIQYRKNTEATDITFNLETTTNLEPQSWQTLTPDGSTIIEDPSTAIDADTDLIRIRILHDPQTQTKRFFRLNITAAS